MTEGISKERLIELRDGGSSPEFRRTLKWLVHNECKELNPWMPIDENTPKDRTILICDIGYGQVAVDWNEFTGSFSNAHRSKYLSPTHWQFLPENPKDD